MGTSKSSTGSPSGVPMVPPWVPAAPASDSVGGGYSDSGQDGSDVGPAPGVSPANPIAPAGRFGSARSSLGRYARHGSADEMRKGIGNYVRKGWGGGKTAAQRLAGSARTAGTLYGALSAFADGQPAPGTNVDPAVLAGRSADEVMSAVVEAVRPVDGTQDTESARKAIQNALSELLEQNPDASLVELNEQEKLFVVERFLALDIYNHLFLDIGKAVQDKAPSIAAATSRLREIKSYVKQAVAAAFRKLAKQGQKLSASRVAALSRACIQEAMHVFEGYAQ
jgi:hypothetical protein